MKTYSPVLFLLLGLAVSSCTKQNICIGPDCIYPEAVVAIDSMNHDHVYVTLINQDNDPVVCTLVLSPEINREDFKRFTGYLSFSGSQPKGDDRILKVYYVSSDQSYIHDEATFVNAFNTTLEIVAYGDDLSLSY